jgi:hypothetical protein
MSSAGNYARKDHCTVKGENMRLIAMFTASEDASPSTVNLTVPSQGSVNGCRKSDRPSIDTGKRSMEV